MARVFSAIDIEDSQVLKELENIQATLDLGFNPVPPEKMHVTLQFFKDINQEQIQELKQAMEGIETSPFEAQIKDVGAFPSEDFIRVIWAGAENHEIREIYRQVKNHDVNSDSNKEFNPHITLMRVKDISPQRKKKLQKAISEFRDHDFGTERVEKVKLFRSDLGPDGPEYTQIDVKHL